MEFRLLGRVEAEHDGQPLELGRRRERCLLGVLLLEANRAIPIDRLVDLLWDGQAPLTARASLHTHVSRLRARLQPDGAGRSGAELSSHKGGYLIRVDRDRVDAHRFQSLVLRAQATDGVERIDLLRQALALWRGPLLADSASAGLRERIGAGLNELRMSATESMLDAELANGRHQELVGELSGLVGEHPHRERLTGQLMLALSRSGRHADALAAYQRLNARLSEDLGIDPGPELRELYAAILRREPGLTGPDGVAFVPAQLPAAPGWFTGRAAELTELTKALDGQAGAGGTVVISAIGGTGGIGKTWLALHWAHQHLDRFPDGQLFVNLRGFDPSGRPMSPPTAVRGLLSAFGVGAASMPVDFAGQLTLYRSLVAGRRMLIVLDNARDAAQVEDLLPNSATCVVLITSRDRLTGLAGRQHTHALPLDTLVESAAREMLARRLGEDRMPAEPEAVATLLSACGGLPLALGIAAARAVMQPQLSLAVIAAELRDTATRLSALDDGDPQAGLRAVMSWSYRALPPEQARMLLLLGVAAGQDIGLAAACALAGLATEAAGAVLAGLERQSLVQQHVPGRWRMHDLVRLYAAEQAPSELREDDRAAALRRLVGFYLRTAHVAGRLLDPHHPAIEVDPVEADAVNWPAQPLRDQAEALAWLDAEHACLLAAQQLAVRHGWDRAVWQLAWTLNAFHQRRGHLDDDFGTLRAGLAAAENLGDAVAQGQAHRMLGHACVRMDRFDESLKHLGRALALAQEAGDLAGQALAHALIAGNWGRRPDSYHQALEHAIEALRLRELLDDPVWEADALNCVGWYEAQLGRYGQAHARCERALALCREHGDREGEAHTLDSLGYIAWRTGQLRRALGYYHDSLALFRELGNDYGEADTLEHLGEAHHDLGEFDKAIRSWREALTMYQAQRRMPEVARVRRRLEELEQSLADGEPG